MNAARQVVCRILLIVMALLTVTLTSSAQTVRAGASENLNASRMVSYSGQVAAIGEATVRGITFAVYRQQTGGAPLWLETQNVTVDPAGRFTVLLGSTTSGVPEDLFLSTEPRWLGVQVQGQEEQTRVVLSSVPYAFKAIEAETLGGHPAAEFITREALQSAVHDAQQSTAILASGVQSPVGHGSAPPGEFDFGSYDFVGSNQSYVISAEQIGPGTALVASAPNNSAVIGLANSDRPAHVRAGVEGASSLDNSYGVFGLATSDTSPGIGTYGQSDSPNGTGVRGYATDPTSTAVGVFGVSASTAGIGVAATATATSGLTFGMVATAKSSQGTGLLVQNTAGGPLIRAKTDQTLFTLDGAGNLSTAGTVTSGASFSGRGLTISGAGSFTGALSAGTISATGLQVNGAVSIAGANNGLTFSDGTHQTTASNVTLNANTFSGGQEAPQLLADSRLIVGSNPATMGQATLMPDNLDTVHSYLSTNTAQTRFRLSSSSPDPNGAQHFMIVPYAYGMGIEYPGVLESWVQDFSVHMNHQLGDPTAAAHLWVGDEVDSGGLFVTSRDNGGGNNSYTALASDRFSHQSHGSLRYQLRSPSDAFQFQWGPYQSEVTRASFTTSSTATRLNLMYGPVQGALAVDANGSGAMSVGSVSSTPLTLVAGNTAAATVFPDGNVSIGNAVDSVRLSVGSGGLFTVNDAGAATAASLSATSISATSFVTGALSVSGQIMATGISASGTLTSAAVNTGALAATSINANSVTTPALNVTSATATTLISTTGAASSFTLGNGTPIVGHLSVVAPLTFNVIAGNSCQTQTTAVTGAADGDSVALGIPSTLGAIDGVTWFAWVSASGVISVRGCNALTMATAPPPPASIRIDVWKH